MNVELYVMQGCAVCPQMKQLFRQLLDESVIDALDIIDVKQLSEVQLAALQIRSLPHYLIDGKAFTGLRSRDELMSLLRQGRDFWAAWIEQSIASGELSLLIDAWQGQEDLMEAVFHLLSDPATVLNIRIGLSAFLEHLAETGALNAYGSALIALSDHEAIDIAEDGLYYLSLLSDDSALRHIQRCANDKGCRLQHQAIEILDEMLEASH